MTPENAVAKSLEVFEDLGKDDKTKINEMLWYDAQIYQNLGKDSLGSDKERATKASACIYRYIKAIDHDMGQRFLNAMGYTR